MSYEYHTEPFAHQREAEIHRDKIAWGHRWEMGTGKSKVMVDLAGYLYEKGEIDAVLVVAPNGVHDNWVSTDSDDLGEFPIHFPPRLRGGAMLHAWQTKKAGNKSHKAAVEKLLKTPGLAVLAVSYDGFMTKLAKLFVKRFLRQRRVLFVLDESHNIKTPSAKRSISIVAAGKWAKYRRFLTGTMVSHGPFDVYQQIKFLIQDFWVRYRLSSMEAFKTRYGVWRLAADVKKEKGYDPGYDKLVGYQRVDEVREIVASISDRVTKEDAGLNLPERLYETRHVELTPEQWRLYRELKEQYETELATGEIVSADLAIVRLLRFQQIICGYVGTEDGELVRLDRNPRIEALEDLRPEISGQAIIWARFTEDIEQILHLLGDAAVRYDGKIDDDQALENKRAFKRGDAQFFVGNPQKGATGLTLNEAKTTVYYSNSFRLLDRLQSEDRNHRIGQTNNVLYLDLVSKGTIDQHIVRSLRSKFDIASQINGETMRSWI